MSNLNKLYHKGKFRNGEWGKHLRPYQKRLGNKRFRKAVLDEEENEFGAIKYFKKRRKKKPIRVKITLVSFGGMICSYYKNYSTMKNALDAINQAHVIRYHFISDDDHQDVHPKPKVL